jgi:hypothetical protein
MAKNEDTQFRARAQSQTDERLSIARDAAMQASTLVRNSSGGQPSRRQRVRAIQAILPHL